jgi:hypothetical protein
MMRRYVRARFPPYEEDVGLAYSSHSHYEGNIPAPLTELRLAQQTVVNLYPSAVSEWGEVIARFDRLRTNEEPSMPSEKAEDDLALWLDDLDMDSGEQESHPEMFGLPVLDIGHISMYRCSDS